MEDGVVEIEYRILNMMAGALHESLRSGACVKAITKGAFKAECRGFGQYAAGAAS
jgi:hypothetical protein